MRTCPCFLCITCLSQNTSLPLRIWWSEHVSLYFKYFNQNTSANRYLCGLGVGQERGDTWFQKVLLQMSMHWSCAGAADDNHCQDDVLYILMVIVTIKWSLSSDYGRRRSDLKWLWLPKFPTIFDGSPRNFQISFYGSPQNLIQIFTEVNGSPRHSKEWKLSNLEIQIFQVWSPPWETRR